MRRRRLSKKPENVKRRLANHVAQALAVAVLAGGYYVLDTYIAPVGDNTVVQPQPGVVAAMEAAAAQEPFAETAGRHPGDQIDLPGKEHE